MALLDFRWKRGKGFKVGSKLQTNTPKSTEEKNKQATRFREVGK